MSAKMFRCLRVDETGDKQFTRQLVEKSIDDLPAGDVLIRVHYSSLNYKDALSATGNKGVTRNYPHTPGIDAAGEVEESASAAFKPGERVLVTGFDLGMNTSGGFAEYVRVPADWVVALPQGLSLRESMILGTAGFTAALSVLRLEEHGIKPDDGEVLVTGASGGVGSLAVAILAHLGYRVAAVTGKTDAHTYLRELGAAEILERGDIDDQSGRPLLKGRWAAAVDTVGGNPLATALKSTRYGGAVTACGLVASPKLETTVMPFILRGVSLLGVDSVECPMPRRRRVWQRLAGDWKPPVLGAIASEHGLEELDELIERILKGRIRGRSVIRIAG